MKKLEITIIILISFIIGFSVKGIIQYQLPEIIETPRIIEKNTIEKCQCFNLTREDVGLIIRQEFVDALEFNYAIDDALGKPRLVPLLKEILKQLTPLKDEK